MLDVKTVTRDLEELCESIPANQEGQEKIRKLTPAQMAALASSLGRKHGIRVQFGDDATASTDGNTVILPVTSRENSWIVRGYLDHELAHIRLTDFSQIPVTLPLQKTLWNVLEDVRIEKKMAEEYPGMATNYRALVRELVKTNPDFFEIKKGSAPDFVLAGHVSLMLRSLYLGQAELAGHAMNVRELFLEMFGPEFEKALIEIMARIPAAESSADAAAIAEEIIALLNRHAEPPPDENDSGDTDPPGFGHGECQEPGEGQDGDLHDANQINGDKNADETPTDDSQQETADEGNHENTGDDGQQGVENKAELGDDEDSEKGNTGSAQPEDEGPDNQAARNAIQQALESQEERMDFGEKLRDLAETEEFEGRSGDYRTAVPAGTETLVNAGYEMQAVNTPTAVVAKLSSRLRGLLQARDLKGAAPGMAGNRIARQRLHRIRTGEARLFLKKEPDKAVNTAIHLVVDNSSSMQENQRFCISREVVLGLYRAVSTVRGVNPAVTVFPAYYPYPKNRGRTVIPVAGILSHGQRLESQLLYPREPYGQTPLAAAVRYGANCMANLPEPRRIMVILTDGEPDCVVDAGEAIQRAMEFNIEVACLGIEELVCPEIFPNFEIVKNADDLPEKTFNLFEKLLLPKS